MNKNAIMRGFEYLQSVQNTDHGIPGAKPGGVSGCWTSAETLETILLSPYNNYSLYKFAEELIDFLLDTQFGRSHEEFGAWPLLKNGNRGSAMATGHAVAAFSLAKKIFGDKEVLLKRSINDAFNWLENEQNADGGWGVEPRGGLEGRRSRLISTVYVLKGYICSGYSVENSRTVRNAINYITALRNIDFGFSGFQHGGSDPCYTARAITMLINSAEYEPTDKVIRQSIDYINKVKPKKTFWALDIESYVADDAPGQTVYNNNTVADVLEAFSTAEYCGCNTEALESWFINKQELDGKWYLGASARSDITTWSTNEAIHSLICVESLFAHVRYPQLISKTKWYRKVITSLLVIIVLLVLVPLQIPSLSAIAKYWHGLPGSLQSLLFTSIFLAITVNVFSSFLSNKLHEFVKKRNIGV